MEVQLEEEYDEKQKVLKEKRELESNFLSVQDQVNTVNTVQCNRSSICKKKKKNCKQISDMYDLRF